MITLKDGNSLISGWKETLTKLVRWLLMAAASYEYMLMQVADKV